MTETIEALLAGSSSAEAELQPLRAALADIVAEAEHASFDEEVSLEAVRELLDERIENDAPARGFLTRGVTFCAMLPMRTIPFRVVALLGMGDTDFPRATRSVGFDLIAHHPQRGDRSRRDDDRYLFLEALLSARDRVLVTYVGQSIVDNSVVPPSVVVSDLLDELEQTFVPPDHDAVSPSGLREHIVVRHPMQPFSPRYFGASDDSRLFSFEAVYWEGARALTEEGAATDHAPLLLEPLPELAGDADRTVSLSRLIRFFRQPAAELLKRRLGVYLDDWSRDRTDREPMELEPLDEWKLGTALLRHEIEGLDPQRSLELLRAGGELPLGTPGDVRFEDLRQLVAPIAATAEHWCSGGALPPLDIDLTLDGEMPTRLIGTISGRWPKCVATPQYARLGAKHLLAAWIQHLALCATQPEDQTSRTIVISRADKGNAPRLASFGPVDDAPALLRGLVELYWAGQREPLLLFPKSSHAFAAAMASTEDRDKALHEARKQWTDRFLGERDEPHLRRLFGEADVLASTFAPLGRPPSSGDFAAVAMRVFGPLLEHLKEDV